LIERLEQGGFGAWTALAKLWEIRDLLAGVLGEGRVLVGCDGFNTVGRGSGEVNRSPEIPH
jgi:hypothetical protein